MVSIGNFDGVHRGHQAILARARQVADVLGVPVVAITFDPFPIQVLRPGQGPPRLMSIQRREAALREAGADRVEVLRPTRELLGMMPEAFLDWLCADHCPAAIVEGPDFRFGRNRQGDLDLIRRFGDERGFESHVVERVHVALCDQLVAPVSSSMIRWLLGHGRVADAALCLGRHLSLWGVVVAGERRGRSIGVPTANLDPAALADQALPADGVYGGVAVIPGDGSSHAAAISIGVKPHFGQRQRVIEAHLLDFGGDLYRQRIELRFARWLREQQPFPSLDALRAQLGRDLDLARRWHELGLLATLPRPPKLAGRAE